MHEITWKTKRSKYFYWQLLSRKYKFNTSYCRLVSLRPLKRNLDVFHHFLPHCKVVKKLTVHWVLYSICYNTSISNMGHKAADFYTVIKSTEVINCIEAIYLKNCSYKHDTGFDNALWIFFLFWLTLSISISNKVTAKSIYPQFQINILQKLNILALVHIPFFCQNY